MQRDVLALYLEETLEKLPAEAQIESLVYTARRDSSAPQLRIEHNHPDSAGSALTFTLDDSPVVTGQHAQEVMHHFMCGSCEKWWHIEDDQLEPDRILTCPHCGTKQTFEEGDEL